MSQRAEQLRERAAHCRRLADCITRRNDPTRLGLLAMAVRVEGSRDRGGGVTSAAEKSAEAGGRANDEDEQR
jgi:hypothetical protein